MPQLSDYTTAVQELVHDSASIDFSAAELTGFVNNARNRAALDFHCVRNLFANCSLIAGQESYPIQSGIYGLFLVLGGSGYISPTITISPPGGPLGAPATAVAVVSNGVITQINMTASGLGYTVQPTVTITDVAGGGSGAVVIPVTGIGTFDLNSISVLWGLQRYTMGWLPWTMFQAFCRANPSLRRQPAVWSLFAEQNLFFVYPIPDQAYVADFDVLSLPSPLSQPTDIDLQVLAPHNDAVPYYAAHLALLKLQNFDQADYYEKKYEKRVGEIIRTKQDRRIMNIYRNAWRRINRW